MKKQLPDFSAMKVLVIGDVMLDQYIFGSVRRISPEAPVPVMLRENTRLMAGGAANVALNIRALGATPLLLGSIGKDLSGDRLLSVLEEEGIDARFIHRSDAETTTVKTRLIAGSQHMLRIDEENTALLDPSLENTIRQQLTSIVEQVSIDAILVEDYDKGMMTPGLTGHIRSLAAERNIFLAVDPKFRHFRDYQHFDLFKPNLREVNQALGRNFETNLTDLVEAGKALRELLDYGRLMITLGKHGIFAMEGDDHFLEPARKLDIVDVCGAGDAVISIATLCLSAGLSLPDTLYWSNRAGAEVCRHPGVVAVGRKDLDR
jgi:rfaE bifunctional protein kinase chain/domain